MTADSRRQLAGLVLLGLALFLAGCEKTQETYRLAGAIADSGYRVSLVGNFDEAHLQLLEEGVADTLKSVEGLISAEQESSERTLLNRSSVGLPVLLSEPAAVVLRAALAASHARQEGPAGAGDHHRDFGHERDFVKIEPDTAVSTSGPLLDYRQAFNERVPISVDFSPVARGYAADRVAAYLDDHDVEGYLVEVGGQLRSRGHRPGGAPWHVAITHDGGGETHDVRAAVTLGDAALATVWAGRDTLHDKKRRDASLSVPPADFSTSRPAIVTVIADRCAVAATWAVTLARLESEAALKVAERESIAAYFVVQTDSGFKTIYSSAFTPYLGQAGEGERS